MNPAILWLKATRICYIGEKMCLSAQKSGFFLTDGQKLAMIGRVIFPYAAVVELADTRDLKSLGSNTIPVRARSAAPDLQTLMYQGFAGFCFFEERFKIFAKSAIFRPVPSKMPSIFHDFSVRGVQNRSEITDKVHKNLKQKFFVCTNGRPF